jgi:pyruvate dehydrogenase E1 component alpha subunit
VTQVVAAATDLFTLIDLDGSCDASLEPDLSEGALQTLYRTMLLTRRVDERAMRLQRQGRIATYVASTGQEASHVGSAFATALQDWMFPSYRELGAALMRGFGLNTLFCQLFGNADDLQKGHQMPVHWGDRRLNIVTSSSPLGTQLPMAVGVAFAARYGGDPMVTLAYFGDGATSTSDFHAALNFAGVWRVPTVFFCANNKYAISMPVEQQTAAQTLAIKATAYGFEGVRVDGADVLAVYVATKVAVDKARQGGGPTLIEAVAERIAGHTSSDDPTRYRDSAELEAAKKKDPLERFRRYLARKNLWGTSFEQTCCSEIDSAIAEAIRICEPIAKPHVGTLFEDVYATMPAHLLEQLREANTVQFAGTPMNNDVVSVMDEEDARRRAGTE